MSDATDDQNVPEPSTAGSAATGQSVISLITSHHPPSVTWKRGDDESSEAKCESSPSPFVKSIVVMSYRRSGGEYGKKRRPMCESVSGKSGAGTDDSARRMTGK